MHDHHHQAPDYKPLTPGGTLLLDAASSGHVQIAADLLRIGQVVAIPTETVYGLACVLEDSAVAKVFAAKGRPQDNPLIVHIAAPEELPAVAAEIPPAAQRAMERFWPGPLTLVLPKQPSVPLSVTAGLDTVAVRCPESAAARALIAAVGQPLAAPSANRSGSPSPVTAGHVAADLDGRVAAIVDGGPCVVGLESTVLDVTGPIPRLLRPGGVTAEQLEEALGEILLDASILQALQPGDAPRSPGMKYKHYAPATPLKILRGSAASTRLFLEGSPGSGLLCPQEEEEAFAGLPVMAYTPASLFDVLRAVDSWGVDEVYVRVPATAGVGLAVCNRLYKAAGFSIVDLENQA